MSRRKERSVDVVLCPDGPMLVRGASTITDSDGRSHVVERPVVAVCRCGSSAIAPWCDGTHKALQRRSMAGAAAVLTPPRPPTTQEKT